MSNAGNDQHLIGVKIRIEIWLAIECVIYRATAQKLIGLQTSST